MKTKLQQILRYSYLFIFVENLRLSDLDYNVDSSIYLFS